MIDQRSHSVIEPRRNGCKIFFKKSELLAEASQAIQLHGASLTQLAHVRQCFYLETPINCYVWRAK
jgi:hypothetical protein